VDILSIFAYLYNLSFAQMLAGVDLELLKICSFTSQDGHISLLGYAFSEVT